ncbi:MAG: hypothetical protein DWQ10_06395 [Calditrichaeota bacterium]|nr:MAG: hypothetical protein DWQ10_06395 [Calditrichota bacterium]
MKNIDDKTREAFQELLTKAFDGELSVEEQKQFNHFVEQFPECAKEWQEMQSLRRVTSTMKFKEPAKEVWDMYWLNTYNRLERGIAWILFSVGAILVGAFVLYNFITQFLQDSHVPAMLRWGIAFLAIGGAALFVSVLREKLFTSKNDPYKEIER